MNTKYINGTVDPKRQENSSENRSLDQQSRVSGLLLKNARPDQNIKRVMRKQNRLWQRPKPEYKECGGECKRSNRHHTNVNKVMLGPHGYLEQSTKRRPIERQRRDPINSPGKINRSKNEDPKTRGIVRAGTLKAE